MNDAMHFIKFFLSFALCLFIVFTALFVFRYLSFPIEEPGRQLLITIPEGATFQEVARRLHRQKIIKDPFKFTILARISGAASKVQAGEFRVNTAWSRPKLLKTLVRGQALLHTLRIPEGLTWWETGRLVQESGLTTFDRFEQAVHNQDLLREFDIPTASAEGYLFPETYALPRPEDRDALPIVRLLISECFKNLRTQVWPSGLPEPAAIHAIITLASLVEKETAKADERRRIAGVYANRLDKGMRLQCDPTVIYGIGPDFNGNLTRRDLNNRENPYNTYRHSGLPPGPICSPGLAAIQAAADPEDHNLYYFVAKDSGSHVFSRTLKEHNAAVRKYQLNQK